MKTKSKANAGPRTIDDYLERLRDDQRAALASLRRDLRKLIPGAEESISYQIPTLRVNGKPVLSFAAWAKHCALYPGAVVQSLEKELKGYKISKGTIQFPLDRPLPAPLLRKVVKACVERRVGKGARRPS